MITSRSELIYRLETYKTDFAEEAPFTKQFLELLTAPTCYYRDHLPGHITGSSWVLNQRKDHVLLLLHGKLNKWLQPGGHADGDENIFGVSLREAREETGLKKLDLIHDGLFDIDIHPIPQRKDFPEHLHYDVRFCFLADDQEPLLISEESHQLAWIKIEDLVHQTQGNESIRRMYEKTKGLF